MDNLYESEKLLGEYLLFHYGQDDEVMPWSDGPHNGLHFPVRTVHELIDSHSLKTSTNPRALDVGCSVGRSAFELTAYCEEVQGCDLSQSFIDAAKSLAERFELPYQYLEEGDLYKSAMAQVKCPVKTSPTFFVADACDLPTHLYDFDVVHAANLICRLPDPNLFFNQLPKLVKKGGQLILASPFTWLEEYTSRDKWIGSGDSESKLVQYLSPFFELEKKVELPFVIREHRRKFQYSVSLGTRWRRVCNSQ